MMKMWKNAKPGVKSDTESVESEIEEKEELKGTEVASAHSHDNPYEQIKEEKEEETNPERKTIYESSKVSGERANSVAEEQQVEDVESATAFLINKNKELKSPVKIPNGAEDSIK